MIDLALKGVGLVFGLVFGACLVLGLIFLASAFVWRYGERKSMALQVQGKTPSEIMDEALRLCEGDMARMEKLPDPLDPFKRTPFENCRCSLDPKGWVSMKEYVDGGWANTREYPELSHPLGHKSVHIEGQTDTDVIENLLDGME